MTKPLIRFREIDWVPLATGAREKRVVLDSHCMRLVEFSPGFQEVNWCHAAHCGIVIRGEFTVQFEHTETRYQEGDGIHIPAGERFKHRAVVDRPVTLFLVES